MHKTSYTERLVERPQIWLEKNDVAWYTHAREINMIVSRWEFVLVEHETIIDIIIIIATHRRLYQSKLSWLFLITESSMSTDYPGKTAFPSQTLYSLLSMQCPGSVSSITKASAV